MPTRAAAAGALSSFTIGTATAVRAPASAVSCAAVCPDGARWGRPCPPFGAAPVWRWSTAAHASLFRLKAYATFGNGSAHLLLIMLWITSNSNGSNSSMLFPRLTTALELQAPGSLDVVMLSEAQSITPRRVNAQREQLGLHRFNPFDYG